MFKILNMSMYPSLLGSLTIDYAGHDYDTRSREALRLPLPRVDPVRINFSYQFVNVWNSIPNIVKQTSRLSTFKSNYRKYIIDGY